MQPTRRGGVKVVLVIICINIFFLVQYSSNLEINSTSTDRDNIEDPSTSGDEDANPLLAPWNISEANDGVRIFHENIDTIRLLGERHSGTTYLTRYLQKCFPGQSVNDYLVRKKHWFQPSPAAIKRAALTVDRESLDEATNFQKIVPDYRTWWDIAHHRRPQKLFQTSLVLLVVRDPYQWIEAMRLRPWHWPNHLRIVPKNETTLATMKYNPDKANRRRLQGKSQGQISELRRSAGVVSTPRGKKFGDTLPGSTGIRIQKSYVYPEVLDWKDFIRAPMRLLDEATMVADSAKICQKGFPKGTVSPCLQNHSYVPPTVSHIPRSFLRNLPFAVNDAVYELKLSTEPFEHPLALRAAKIRNLINIVQAWDLGGFAVVKYEDVLGGSDNNSTNLIALVQQIANALGIQSQCPPHKELTKEPYTLPEEFAKWVGDHTDWEAESLIGYTRADLEVNP
jgi:hypothetical protein